MNNKEIDKIKEALSKNIDNKDNLLNFNIGDFKKIPNQSGCFFRNGKWFLYETDEKNQYTFCGPFELKGIIYACAMKLFVSKKMKEYRFTEEEFNIFLNNHFHSLEEIDSYGK